MPNPRLRVGLYARVSGDKQAQEDTIASQIEVLLQRIAEDVLSVTIIPHTYRNTTLGGYRAGSRVNLECDVLAKHVEKLLRPFWIPA